jgi:hypothetical protein
MTKNYREFEIRRPGFTDYLTLRVFKSPGAMRRGYRAEYENWFKKFDENGLDAAIGICFKTPYMENKHNNKELMTCNNFCIIFLNEKEMSYNTVIHECVHAAFAHEKYIERFALDYSGEEDITFGCSHEERLCYYTGWLAAEALRVLRKQGYLRG